MSTNDRPAHPVVRAFVVMLHAECEPARDDLRGRIEHVHSGLSTHFASLGELLAFLARITTSADDEAS
jgi:hypothetical protein